MSLDLTYINKCSDAVYYLKSYSQDVLIRDWNLNDVDNREVIRYIQGDVRHQAVKIVAVSAISSNDFDSATGLSDDVVLMNKPVHFGTLKSLTVYYAQQKRILI